MTNQILMSNIELHSIWLYHLHVGYQIDATGTGTILLILNENSWIRDFQVGHVSSFFI